MKPFSRKPPTMGKEQFVRFAGAVGDFNPVHYDLEFAKALGMPNVISQGPLTYALALDAAAVGETVGDGGFVLAEPDVAECARLAATLLADETLHELTASAGYRRPPCSVVAKRVGDGTRELPKQDDLRLDRGAGAVLEKIRNA